MTELLQEIVKTHNLPFTILVLLVVIYWLIAAIGLVEIDGFGGADIDLDVDLDIDTDSDFTLSNHTTGLTSNGLLRFTGLSDAPLIFILSLLVLFLWAINFLTNYYLNPEGNLKLSIVLLIPVSIASAILTRLAVKPFAPLMKYIRSKEPVAQIIGSIGRVESGKLDQEFGRITVDFDGRPQLIRSVLAEQFAPLNKGDMVLVVQKLEENTDVYIVHPYGEK